MVDTLRDLLRGRTALLVTHHPPLLSAKAQSPGPPSEIVSKLSCRRFKDNIVFIAINEGSR